MQGHRSTFRSIAGIGPPRSGGALRRRALLGAIGLTLGLLTLIGGASAAAASPYPPNTVVSTYVDPRYCNGLVSVVTDESGNLINVCAVTGQRIYPVFADLPYAYAPGYAAPAYVDAAIAYNGYAVHPFYGNGFYPSYGYYPYGSTELYRAVVRR